MVCAVRAARTPVAFRARALAALRATALYGAGATAVIGLALLPFALSKGGLQAMYECVIEYNRAYANVPIYLFYSYAWQLFINWLWVGLCVVSFCILTFAAFGKALHERRTRDMFTGLIYLGLLAFAFAEVFIQRKYFMYHWVAVWPFFALIVTWALVELISSVRGVMVAAIFSATMLLTAGTVLPRGFHFNYTYQVRDTWNYVRGEMSLAQFSDLFKGPFGNNQSELREIAALIRKRARPHDTLCVRGFMPAIYLSSGLHCPSRFPWEQHLGLVWQPPLSLYPSGDIRAVWIEEHQRALAIHPPTFIVTYASWYVDRYRRLSDNYREIAVFDWLVLLERDRAELSNPNVR
jgi:hypothetical protein